LTNLWTSAFYEKKLSKPVLAQINLLAIIRKLQAKVKEGKYDFNTLSPMILGLAKIYQKKMHYLLGESQQTLETLKNPFSVENKQPVRYAGDKSKVKREGAGKKGYATGA
jgi:hypothetical protein